MMLSWIPENWGEKHEAPGAGAAHTHTGPNSINCVTNAHYFLAFFSALPHRTRALNSDQRHTNFSPAGSFEIFPQNSDLFSSWSSTKETLIIGLSSTRLAAIAKLEHENDLFELHQLKIGVVDKKALFLAQQMKEELLHQEIGYGEGLDALLTLFGLHVLRSHSSLKKKPSKIKGGGLSPHAWSMISDYIHAHLGQKLTIEKLAEITLLSPSHFLRAFREKSGDTPHQYILKARLSAARDLISQTDAPLNEIAKTAGFASNAHMATSIKRVWGATPSQLRKASRKSL